jgi:uncharacterized membrane protein
LLQRAYLIGDLSVVYPLARGTGLLLAALGGIILFGERVSMLAAAGIVAIVAGSLALVRTMARPLSLNGLMVDLRFGLATAVFIAAYTLWDAHAVAVVAIPPLLLDWAHNFGRALLLAPVAARSRTAVLEVWRSHRREVLAVGCLSPFAYTLALTAFTLAPVSYIAPAREFSVVIGAALGAWLLDEPGALHRVLAAGLIVVGIIGLVLG